MSRRFFGTDGVRGVANEKLTPELAFKLGRAAGLWLVQGGLPLRAVLGSDTRISGTMLAAAVSAGLCSAGVSVNDLGVAPTPTVSFVARTEAYGLGVVVSASHNPAPDNGIKFVGHDGRKLTDSQEEQIEVLMGGEGPRPIGGKLGAIVRDTGGVDRYMAMLESTVPERLEGWRVAVDAAHGAAYELGPAILRRLGATVFATGVDPTGTNINAEGGATKPDTLAAFTRTSKATVGVAFDGDADRAVFCDAEGRLINGDRTIAIWAGFQKEQNKLSPAVVVGTVMSNGGFEKYVGEAGIHLERAPVGDKYVAQKIEETGALIGGEQSGHIIFPHRGPTGDGLVTMLELFRVLKLSGKTAKEAYESYEPWPQLLVNVGVSSTEGWHEALRKTLDESEAELGSRGRIVVRPSGTQPMIRVMVESDEVSMRDRIADSLVRDLEEKLGGHVEGRVDLTYALGD